MNEVFLKKSCDSCVTRNLAKSVLTGSKLLQGSTASNIEVVEQQQEALANSIPVISPRQHRKYSVRWLGSTSGVSYDSVLTAEDIKTHTKVLDLLKKGLVELASDYERQGQPAQTFIDASTDCPGMRGTHVEYRQYCAADPSARQEFETSQCL